MLRRWGVLLALCLAGPTWAGETGEPGVAASAGSGSAWVAQYRLRDAQGDRTLVVVRDEHRVEYRSPGEPVRTWRKVGDGTEHRQIFPAERQVVVYAPGDLRALGHEPDWNKLTGLVDPGLRGQLRQTGVTTVAGEPARRYRGSGGGGGTRIDLIWLEIPALPARYRRGAGKSRFELTLGKLQRQPADQVFTRSDGYRELGFADIGDMELDQFAKRYILQGF